MKKKLTALILGAMMVMSAGALTVQANNCVDTTYSFNFSNATQLTGVRQKQDSTSSYMSCSYAGASYSAHVYSVQGGIVDCSFGHTYQFSSGVTSYMLNNVYERGYHNAGIYATRNYGYGYTAKGVWSPDSV
ncbi:MAG: hypothetical protein PHG16_03930 [Lachnospiraceae bacterium]|nr:hypothetical protein [Lachnospiraceae bacterium]